MTWGDIMTFYDLAKRRYSVRQFTNERIPKDKLENILENKFNGKFKNIFK